MRISDVLSNKQTFSYEIFPPRGSLSVERAGEIAGEFIRNEPDWISVTFSAGASDNNENTLAMAKHIEQTGKSSALAHLICMGSSTADIDRFVQSLLSCGVQNILALRGDRAPGRKAGDFQFSSQLIAHLKELAPELCVGGACYPEGHLECPEPKRDLEHLKEKQDSGVDFLVTQLFFNNDDFYRFRESCVRARIKVPLIAGIMPFTSTNQIQRMAFNCGASIPAAVIKRLAAAGDNPEAQRQAGIEYACEQLRDLAANGVDGIHVYCMNSPQVAQATHDCLAEVGYLH